MKRHYMKKIHLNFLVGLALMCLLYSCHKETRDLATPPFIPVPYQEIVDSSLQWRYEVNKQVFSAILKGFKDGSNANSAYRIKGVYVFADSLYYEIPWGNPGNSDKVYYEIEMKSLILHKKFQLNGQTPVSGMEAAIAAAIAQAYAVNLKLPRRAKVVFRQ